MPMNHLRNEFNVITSGTGGWHHILAGAVLKKVPLSSQGVPLSRWAPYSNFWSPNPMVYDIG